MATILIAEDNFASRKMLVSLLGYKGYRLLQAADGAEALELARAEHPDLVIADLLMPEMDGYEFARRLRAEPSIARTPLIFYTATYALSEAQSLADICGAFRLLAKPAEPEVILKVVEAALSASVAPASPIENKLFDLQHHRILNDKLSNKVRDLENEIEERKHVEEALKESEARKGALLEAALDCVICIDHEGRIIECSGSS